MKFISKNSNLHVILRPGLPAQPLTGSPAKATISVRFQNGVADIQQEELVQMMLNHPGFNMDFIAADDRGTDPYSSHREDAEPQHVLTEMRYGHPVCRNVSPVKTKLPPELMQIVRIQAESMAKQMLPGMVEEVLKSLVATKSEMPEAQAVSTVSEEENFSLPVDFPKADTPKKSPGRPKKVPVTT